MEEEFVGDFKVLQTRSLKSLIARLLLRCLLLAGQRKVWLLRVFWKRTSCLV